MLLHNRVNRKELEERLLNEPFHRATLSFYRYILLENPQEFRDFLYKKLSELNCFGRIYVAREGINAQMSVPLHHKDEFVQLLNSVPELHDVPLKWAVEDDHAQWHLFKKQNIQQSWFAQMLNILTPVCRIYTTNGVLPAF